VFNFKYIIFLLGDRNGKIIQGVWVKFNNKTSKCYKETLHYIYERSLSPWAYYRRADKFPSKDQIESILPKNHDYYSVKQYFGLWHAMNRSKIHIPSLIRIVRLAICKWNGSKGSSDTVAKMIDECDVKIPVESSQRSLVIFRMFMIAETANHRTIQAFTSKADMSKYMTIERYRKIANNRIAFPSSLDDLTQGLILKIESNSSEQELIHMNSSLDRDS
jgi:hypothetical protein